MKCDILKPSGAPESGFSGNWEYQQDPDSGALVKKLVQDPNAVTPVYREGAVVYNVPLLARGLIDGGIRAAGTTEKFSEIYENVDWVKATFDKSVNITKRDQVTNIRNKRTSQLIWKEEEINGNPPTIFNVMGVTPVMGPFSHLLEYAVLLQRAEVQGG